MTQIKTILVAVDRDGGAVAALSKAMWLARRFGARIEVFMCDAERAYALKHQYDSRGVSAARSACEAESRHYLEKLCASANGEGVPISIETVCETPRYEAIVRRVQESHPDLVVRSMGDRAAADSHAPSETDWQLVRACPVPLLLTHGRQWKKRPRVAAAVDLSEKETEALTLAILRMANDLSVACEAQMEVLHGLHARSGDADALESARKTLQQRIEQAHVPGAIAHIVEGDPADALPAFAADREYDLLVIGALTHHKAMSALVGTLTGRLMDRLPCDFLLVKPPAFVCPVGRSVLAQVSARM